MITVRVQAHGGLFEDPTILERFDQEVSSTLAELGAYGQRLVVFNSPRGVSAGAGGFAGSISNELRGTPARRQAVVSSSVFYAPIVEKGRRPGRRPPLEPIRLWVVRKLGVNQKNAREVAFLVARKIGRRGWEGKHPFERAAKQLLPVARQRFESLQARIGRLLQGG